MGAYGESASRFGFEHLERLKSEGGVKALKLLNG